MTPYYILIAGFIIALYFILRKRKPEQTTDQSISEAERQILLGHVAYYQHLDESGRLKFEHMLKDFLSHVRIEGIDLVPDTTDRLLIACSAVIPIFGFGQWRYQNLHAVILYPDTFNKDFQFEGGDRNIMGMVGTGYMNGQMILSRSALLEGFSINADKENTAIHEFVHLLDKSDGATDGIPENLIPHQYIIPWIKMIHQEINKIEAGQSDINPYAVTNEAEFFAVVSEYFFENPAQFKEKHPNLYQILSIIFSQDLMKK
ncbi:zinc-dependent peptidase [Pedobacter cryoconitis]|uniref:Peptidase n=1 Tax=Pedobacter cryoconitis TaxID=188932 RepID=A0A7X0MI35_9SPHI|nr:M90 family metallopeptidase [Pedobacter cryoconitis]MBB6499759.1 hypothetical protein [Pedobacter cryoconitis]